VIVVRDAPGGLEVLMLRRAAGASFAGGAYVFPGGRVDPADAGDEIAGHCSGLDDATASATLGIASGGLAYWVAAVRECLEEAGVLVGARRDGSPVSLDDDVRRKVHDGSMSMADVCHAYDVVMAFDQVHYVSHWVTPRGEQRRFDTRFFLTALPEGQVAAHDAIETVETHWCRPAEMLERMAGRELLLLPPTVANLERLAADGDVASALVSAAAVERPVRIEPRLRLDETGRWIGIAMPGDPDYDDLD